MIWLICLCLGSKGVLWKKEESALLHEIASWIIAILLFWNWINNMWYALVCIPTEQQSFIVFVLNDHIFFYFFFQPEQVTYQKQTKKIVWSHW